MKFNIFVFSLVLSLYFICSKVACQSARPVCPRGMEWKEGPTSECDNHVCRGAQPICEDDTVRIMGCFCKKANQSKDGDKCVTQCPLYP